MISKRLGPKMSEDYEFKQALVVRLDLKIGWGKIAVQCSHAAVSAAEEARKRVHDWWKTWIADGQPKIALKVPDLDAILLLEQQARTKRFPFSVVKDRGLTQVPPGTITCIGIGPAPVSLLDGLTGNLPLL
jgi:peptidyl-tRNA hydrolase, PTH2 family